MELINKLKGSLDQLKQFESINQSLFEFNDIFKNCGLNIELTESDEKLDQNYCKVKCNSIKELSIKSKLNIESIKRQFVCDINECKKTFGSEFRLKAHKWSHSERQHFKCFSINCNKICKSAKSLIIHKNSIHPKIRYRCNYKDCNKSFQCKQILIKHKWIHSKEKQFKCVVKGCHKTYRHHSSLTITEMLFIRI